MCFVCHVAVAVNVISVYVPFSLESREILLKSWLCHVVVLSKIKVSFNATVVRLEHVPKDSDTGMSLEIRVAR